MCQHFPRQWEYSSKQDQQGPYSYWNLQSWVGTILSANKFINTQYNFRNYMKETKQD